MDVHVNRVAIQPAWDIAGARRSLLIGSDDKIGLSTAQEKSGILLKSDKRQKFAVCRAVNSKPWNPDARTGNGNGNGNGRAGGTAGVRIKDESLRNGSASSVSEAAPSKLEHPKGQRSKPPTTKPSDRTSRVWDDGSEVQRGTWDEPEGPHHALLEDDPLTWMTGTVSDYMTRKPLCLHKSMRLRDAARLFLKHGISGAPVVEKYENDTFGCGRLVGVISQKDMIWKETMHPQEADSLYKMPFYWNYLNAGPMMETLQKQVVKIMAQTVEDSMNANPLCISQDATISEASELMLTNQVSRLVVVAPREAGKQGWTVVGILTGNDILRHVLLLL